MIGGQRVTFSTGVCSRSKTVYEFGAPRKDGTARSSPANEIFIIAGGPGESIRRNPDGSYLAPGPGTRWGLDLTVGGTAVYTGALVAKLTVTKHGHAGHFRGGMNGGIIKGSYTCR
jgi:hypothetical protein